MSQCTQIKKYIEEHGSITQIEAANNEEINCFRLSARIHDLRYKYGVKIETKNERNKNNSGTHARYFLIKDGD